jgi:hypothetical protein
MAFVPLAGTVGTLAALHAAGIGAATLIVLGAAVCLRTARRPGGRLVDDLIRLPVVVAATAGLGLLFAHSRPAADALYLVVFVAARLAWRLGAAVEAVGRALLPLPLVTLFIAPQVALDQLRLRSRPLRLLRRSSAEAGWARTLLDSGPALHAALLDPEAGTRTRVGARVRAVRAGIEPG